MAFTNQVWLAHTQALRPYIPNPHLACFNGLDRQLPPRVRQQRDSRARILGTARALVGEAGFDNVRVAEVAARSGVSLQTLYNLVGSRGDMLEQAGCEWVEMLAQSATEFCRNRGLNTIFGMIDFFWAGAVLQQGYATGVVHSRVCEGVSSEAFVKATQGIFNRQLATLSSAGALVRWADVHKLAHALARASHACVREWTAAPYDAGHFRETLVNECGLLLLGALTGAEASNLERCFDLKWQSAS